MAFTDLQQAIIKSSAKQEALTAKISIPEFCNGAQITIRSIDTATYLNLSKMCTRDGVFDDVAFRLNVIAEAVVDPCLNDAEFMDALKCARIEDVVVKVFNLPGMLSVIERKIEELCGMRREKEASNFRRIGGASDDAPEA